MHKEKISPDYEVYQWDSQKDFFDAIEQRLTAGFHIVKHIHLCVLLEKGKQKQLFSFLPLPEIDDRIEEKIQEWEEEIPLAEPNYDKSILNVISSIRKYYHRPIWYPSLKKWDKELAEKQYQNIIILLLDGLGMNILEKHLPADSFLKRHLEDVLTAVFPSTTAAATTSTKNGLAPIRTGWLGWENYFSEIRKNVVLFNGVDYFTDEPTGWDTYKVLPWVPFYADLEGVEGNIIEPDFHVHPYPFSKVLKSSLNQLKTSEKQIQYVYFQEPDTSLHSYGVDSEEVRQVCLSLNREIEKYASELPPSTLLFITADHGHTDVSVIELYRCQTILKMLKRPPANDSRCIVFSVKEEYQSVFPEIFNGLFGYAYCLYPSKVAIEKGYFGKDTDEACPRCEELLGDFVAIGIRNYYFNYKGERADIFKSTHAGLTADEMFIPQIIYRK